MAILTLLTFADQRKYLQDQGLSDSISLDALERVSAVIDFKTIARMENLLTDLHKNADLMDVSAQVTQIETKRASMFEKITTVFDNLEAERGKAAILKAKQDEQYKIAVLKIQELAESLTATANSTQSVNIANLASKLEALVPKR